MTGMTSGNPNGTKGERPSAEEVEAVMLGTRVLVAITAQSVATVQQDVTLSQLRVLMMLASQGPLNLNTVARGLAVHSSNATRACDRLVASGLLDRCDNPEDRRNLILELTEQCWELVETVMAYRRRAITNVLVQMPATHRRALVPALRSFAAAAGEVPEQIPDSGAWILDWTTPRRSRLAKESTRKPSVS
jgi:DNA-binding MarR family transcriptional regulator